MKDRVEQKQYFREGIQLAESILIYDCLKTNLELNLKIQESFWM